MAVTIWADLRWWRGFTSIWRPLKRPKISCVQRLSDGAEGRKELTLNRERAEQIFQQCYIPDAKRVPSSLIIRVPILFI